MADLLSTKSISQLCAATTVDDGDLFFISKQKPEFEDGQQNWQSYSTKFSDICDLVYKNLSDVFMSNAEEFLTADALDDLSSNWQAAYHGIKHYSRLSARLTADVANTSADVNDLCASLQTLDAKVNRNHSTACISVLNLCADSIARYVPKTDVVNELGNSATKVPSLRLLSACITALSTEVHGIEVGVLTNYVPLSDVVNELGNSATKVPSQLLLTGLSAAVKGEYVQKSDVTLTLGTSQTKVPSENAVRAELSNYVKLVNGVPGEALYVGNSGNDILKLQINNCNVLVCETADEINACKTNPFSYSDIVDTWTKFSIETGTQAYLKGKNGSICKDSDWNPVRDGFNGWKLAPNSIRLLSNTTDFTGYVTPKKYRDYEFTLRCYSSENDDDCNGIVAAYAIDSDKRIHSLSFIRTPNHDSVNGTAIDHHWACYLDCNNALTDGIGYGQVRLLDSGLTYDNERTGDWSAYVGFGVLVQVRRVGNKFYGKTSRFSQTSSDLDYDMLVDLDEVISDPALSDANRAALQLFMNKPTQVGFCTQSQKDSYHVIKSFVDPSKLIVDLTTDEVLTYDMEAGTWNIVSGVTCEEAVGAGRFSYNATTKKLFYCDGSDIMKIGA